MTVKFGVSFELLMNRGLEKNDEGERLTKQETKKSGEISETHSGFGKVGHKRGSGGEALSRRRLWGSGGRAFSLQRIFRIFTRKTLILTTFFVEKGTPVSEILPTRIGIYNNARVKGGAIAPWLLLRAPIWSIHFFNKKN